MRNAAAARMIDGKSPKREWNVWKGEYRFKSKGNVRKSNLDTYIYRRGPDQGAVGERHVLHWAAVFRILDIGRYDVGSQRVFRHDEGRVLFCSRKKCRSRVESGGLGARQTLGAGARGWECEETRTTRGINIVILCLSAPYFYLTTHEGCLPPLGLLSHLEGRLLSSFLAFLKLIPTEHQQSQKALSLTFVFISTRIPYTHASIFV